MALAGSPSGISGAVMDETQSLSDNGSVVDRILRPPLAQQVADRIVDAIAAGVVRPGQRVTDSDIAARFGVSRNPVREAMKILGAQGIVVSNPHRSTHIVVFDQRT